MINRLRMVAFAAAGFAAVSLAPGQVSAEPEPFDAALTDAIPVPVIPALLNDEVKADAPLLLAAEFDLATPTTDLAVEEETLPFAEDAPLQDKVAAFRSTEVADEQLECLAGAVYFESKGESLRGQVAVAQVVQNRVESPRFPSTYCGVVFQRKQFSFVRGGKMPKINKNSRAWENAVAVARLVHEDYVTEGAAKTALFFHANYVSPKWGKKRVATIGNHVFY